MHGIEKVIINEFINVSQTRDFVLKCIGIFCLLEDNAKIYNWFFFLKELLFLLSTIIIEHDISNLLYRKKKYLISITVKLNSI